MSDEESGDIPFSNANDAQPTNAEEDQDPEEDGEDGEDDEDV